MPQLSRAGSLDRAIFIAAFQHAGVVDKSGEPYILHPLRVMMGVRDLGHEAMTKAVLHDVVEDTDMTLSEIEDQWGAQVRIALDGLTHRKGKNGGPKETYFEYIRRCRDTQDPHVIRVKLEDLDDNSDPRRAFDAARPPSTDPSQSRSWKSLISQYEKARKILNGEIP